MDLDHGDGDGRDRIAQGIGVVRIGARVHDDALVRVARILDGVDEDALVVALEEIDLHAQLDGMGPDEVLDIIEGLRAIDRRLTFAEKVQVGAVHHEIAHRPLLDPAQAVRWFITASRGTSTSSQSP